MCVCQIDEKTMSHFEPKQTKPKPWVFIFYPMVFISMMIYFAFPTHKPNYIYKNWNELQTRYVVLMDDTLMGVAKPDETKVYNRQAGIVYRQVRYHSYDATMLDKIIKNANQYGWALTSSSEHTLHYCKDEIGLEISHRRQLTVMMYWSKDSICQIQSEQTAKS